MIGKLICLIRGHKRGKRLPRFQGGTVSQEQRWDAFECPRCGARWHRKMKAA